MGYGTVYRLSGNRRKPWGIRKTVGYEIVDGKLKAHTVHLGSFATRKEAMMALAKYNENPYDANANRMTFEKVYEAWSSQKYETIADSTAHGYKLAFKYCKPLYGMRMREIKTVHMENLAKSIPADKPAIPSFVRNLLNQLFEYGISHELCDKNYAKYMPMAQRSAKIQRIVYSLEQITELWKEADITANMILVGIYTGLRPTELCELNISMFNWENDTIQCGIKTDAGKDRIIPIHSEIKPMLLRYYQSADKNGSLWGGIHYQTYSYRTKKLCDSKNWAHTPHDTRHTFSTQAKECDMDEYCQKLIMGHAIADLTERVYTHRGIDRLKKEMEKLKF